MRYNFTIDTTGKNWRVLIDPAANYGYYERASGEEGGGLWFGDKALLDYDGRMMLPRECCDLIRRAGYSVEYVFYPDGNETHGPFQPLQTRSAA